MSQFEKRIMVLCEGETEKAYISEWASEHKVSHLVSIRTCIDNSPLGLLQEGVKEYFWQQKTTDNPYEEVWLVFDRDSHTSFHKTLDLSERFPFIHLCWSNPCLEAWFIMHFKKLPNFQRNIEVLMDTSAVIDHEQPYVKNEINAYELVASAKQVCDCLKKTWKGYQKGKTDYLTTLKPRMESALEYCLETDLHKDRFAFGSLMPELLNAITALKSCSSEEAERQVGETWFEHLESKRLAEKMRVVTTLNDGELPCVRYSASVLCESKQKSYKPYSPYVQQASCSTIYLNGPTQDLNCESKEEAIGNLNQ